MSKINPRTKGKGFENHCCKLFSTWWGGRFKRVPSSGGWDKTVVTGDIFAVRFDGQVDQSFIFSVESKKQEKWQLRHLFELEDSPIMKWWQQCCNDCPDDKHPLLMFTKNYNPIFVMITAWLYKAWPAGLIHIRHTDRVILRWEDFSSVKLAH